MIGTLVNVAAVVVGSLLGLQLRKGFPEKMKNLPLSDSDKSYPGNGGDRVPLLKALASFTEPTQEPDLRARRIGFHHPPTLCNLGTGRIFPSMSLRCIHLTLKHKQPGLSTALHKENVYKYTACNILSFCETIGLTFVRSRAKVWSSKRISQTAVTKTVRQFGLPESRRLVRADSPSPSDPSLPSRYAERSTPGAPVSPTLQG